MKKKNPLEKFLSEENCSYSVVVRCRTKQEAQSFLKILHKLGYRWCSCSSLLEIDNYEEYREDTCYALGGKMTSSKDCLEFCYIDFFKKQYNSTVIDFCQIANFL